MMRFCIGSDSAELATTSNQEDEVKFYQATSADVAKLFHIDLQGKQPSLVLLKEDDEKLAILGAGYQMLMVIKYDGLISDLNNDLQPFHVITDDKTPWE
ncbi:hypothetical protein L1887_31916 [Cichorium endivia]|nr:hypothetical protein L1887_31916 [Cichorium endivia]